MSGGGGAMMNVNILTVIPILDPATSKGIEEEK